MTYAFDHLRIDPDRMLAAFNESARPVTAVWIVRRSARLISRPAAGSVT